MNEYEGDLEREIAREEAQIEQENREELKEALEKHHFETPPLGPELTLVPREYWPQSLKNCVEKATGISFTYTLFRSNTALTYSLYAVNERLNKTYKITFSDSYLAERNKIWNGLWEPTMFPTSYASPSFELSPPPPETCKWHDKAECRLDLEPEWLTVGVTKELMSPKAFPMHIQKRLENEQAAIASLKRQLREWPICKFGGELSIKWAHAIAMGTQHLAMWNCSHCSKL